MRMKLKEYRYSSKRDAMMKVKRMKELYGYRPGVLKVTHPSTRRVRYIVVKPTGLKKQR